MQIRRIVLVFSALCAAAAASAPPAGANHHRLKIAEVLGGIPGRENAQFVELLLSAAGEDLTHDASLSFLDATGGTLGSSVFTSDLAVETEESTLLAMTSQAASFFGITPDETIASALFTRAGGRLDYVGRPGDPGGIRDALSWGTYSGGSGSETTTTLDNTGSPFNPAGGLPLGISAHRDLGRGDSLTEFDAADDTGDSAADFKLGQPTPVNNAGQTTTRATVVTREPGGAIGVEAALGVTNLIGVQGNPTMGWRIVDAAAPVVLDASAEGTCVTVNVIEVRCDPIAPHTIEILAHDKHDRVRIRGRIAATIFGGVGSDRLIGNAASDTIHGEAGRDTITGGKAEDIVFAGDNDDTVLVKGDGFADDVDCGDGDDTINFDDGVDAFAGCETANP